MSVGHDRYPELHALIERLGPEQANELRRHALRLVEVNEALPAHRLSFTGVGSSANQHLGAKAKQIIRRELRGDASRHRSHGPHSSHQSHRGDGEE